MQVTNRFDNINYMQNSSKQAESKVTPPQLQPKREKIGFLTGAGAYLAGGYAKKLIDKSYNKTIENLIGLNIQITPTKEANISKVLSDAFEKSNLASKGTELVDISKLSDINITMPNGETVIKDVETQVGKLISNEFKEVPIFKQLFKTENKNVQQGLQMGSGLFGKIFTQGDNAGYLMRTNKILVNSEKIGYTAFHEMGHAMNRHFSAIGKSLQKMRAPMMVTAAALPVIALLTNKRSENNPPQTKWQKTKNFIKENVGKLTTLAFVPVIAEEIMASVKGQKLANSFLSKELMKNVTKTHILSASSYIGFALVSGFAAFAGNKIRDLVAHGKKSA